MRPFEWAEFAAVAAAVFLPVALGHRLRKGVISMVLVGSLLAQTVFEGYRWQLIPLHLVAVVMAVADFGWQGRRVSGWPRARRLIVGIPAVAALAMLPLALPVPDLPRPSGPFGIGTRTVVLTDVDRPERYGFPEPEEGTEPPEVARRIVVQMWYPAAIDDAAEPAVWHPNWDVVGPALAKNLGLPSFLLSHLGGVHGRAVENAPPMSGSFPVVIYSHGWTGFRSIALDQMEMLASEGYLVIAADHTYGAIATVFPDTGETVLLDPRALPDEETSDPDDYQKASEELVDTFAGDLELILDSLDTVALGPLSDHVDRSRVGVFGHSTGGGAAVAVCLQDERCKALAGFDAWVEPVADDVLAETLNVPSLFIRSAPWQGTPNDARLRGLVERAAGPVIWAGISTADHNDFVLTPVFSPIADRLGLKGPIVADEVIPFLHQYLDAFFDQSLMGGGGALFSRRPPADFSVERLGGGG